MFFSLLLYRPPSGILLYCGCTIVHIHGFVVSWWWMVFICCVQLVVNYCCTTYCCTAVCCTWLCVGGSVRGCARGIFFPLFLVLVAFSPPQHRPRAGMVRRTTSEKQTGTLHFVSVHGGQHDTKYQACDIRLATECSIRLHSWLTNLGLFICINQLVHPTGNIAR